MEFCQEGVTECSELCVISYMKKCCTCKTEKEDIKFGKNKNEKDGLNKRCKACVKICREKYAYKHIETCKLYRLKNKENKAKYDLEYRNKRREQIKEYKKRWESKFRHEPKFKIKRNLRRRIHHVIKDHCKSDTTMNLLGCSIEEFKAYIESKFQPCMTWDNYGLGPSKWHLDHIRPCCDFNLSNPEDQRKCFHYSNMQPLWEKDNLKKSYMYDNRNCRIKAY